MSSPTPKAYGDIREEALKTFQKAYGVSALYTDYREMLEREKLDLVVISTQAPQHHALTIAAADRKPLASVSLANRSRGAGFRRAEDS